VQTSSPSPPISGTTSSPTHLSQATAEVPFLHDVECYTPPAPTRSSQDTPTMPKRPTSNGRGVGSADDIGVRHLYTLIGNYSC
jgi:hypothetical protein